MVVLGLEWWSWWLWLVGFVVDVVVRGMNEFLPSIAPKIEYLLLVVALARISKEKI